MATSQKRRAVPGELIQRCREGDADAHRELFERTVDDVHRILYRLAGPAEDIEDLVQEVYLALWRALPGFRGESAFSTFLFGVCLRVAKKRGRTWLRWRRLREAAAREPVEPAERPDERVARARQAAAVQRALRRMGFKLRTVLVLFEMEGLSGREIAEKLGIPEKTVWTRLHNARKAFRRIYRWPGTRETRDAAPG